MCDVLCVCVFPWGSCSSRANCGPEMRLGSCGETVGIAYTKSRVTSKSHLGFLFSLLFSGRPLTLYVACVRTSILAPPVRM